MMYQDNYDHSEYDEFDEDESEENLYQYDFIDEINLENKYISAALFHQKIHQVVRCQFTCTPNEYMNVEGDLEKDFEDIHFEFSYENKRDDIPDVSYRIKTLIDNFLLENPDQKYFLLNQENKNLTNHEYSIVFKITKYGPFVKSVEGSDSEAIFTGTFDQCVKLIKPLNSICYISKSFSKNYIEFLLPILSNYSMALSNSVTRCQENIKIIESENIRDYLDCYEESLTEVYKRLFVRVSLYQKMLDFIKGQIVEDISNGHNFDLLSVESSEINKFDLTTFRNENPDLYRQYTQKHTRKILKRNFKNLDLSQENLLKIIEELNEESILLPIKIKR